MKLIVAVNHKEFIGKEGKMMWRSKEDFKHFKKLTTGTYGGILIVGKTTYENDLKGKELPGRECIVIGTNYHTLKEGVEKAILKSHLVPGLENSYNSTVRYKDIWIIGGSSIYQQLLPLTTEIHMSVINNEDEGDVKFEIPNNYRGKVYQYFFDCDPIMVS